MSTAFEKRATDGAGYGLFSTRHISDGEIILNCSRYISAQSAAKDPDLQRHLKELDFDSIPSVNEKLVLTLYLSLHSPFSSPPWHGPFRREIDDLPRTIQNGVWSDEDLSTTSLWPAIMAKRKVLERQWSAIGSELCDFETWKWAESIISSRTIGLADARAQESRGNHILEIEGYSKDQCAAIFDMAQEPDLVLVPVLDLCNHAGDQRTARWELTGSDELILLADRDISRDQEITISYGDEKTDDELFFNYGFVMSSNSDWSITLPLPAPAGVPHSQRQEYWTAVRHHYELPDRLRLSRSGYRYIPSSTDDHEHRISDDQGGEGTASLPILTFWRVPDSLALSEPDLASLLLATNLSLFEAGTLPHYFSPSLDLTDSELRRLTCSAVDVLASVARERVDGIEGSSGKVSGSVAGSLLEGEKRGLSAVLRVLEDMRRGLCVDDP